jgi:hypothetical protein
MYLVELLFVYSHMKLHHFVTSIGAFGCGEKGAALKIRWVSGID